MKIIHILLYVVLALSIDPLAHSAFTPQHLRQLKNHTKSLFQHGWNSYMIHGFPADEVRPITCVPYGPQFTTPDDTHLDVLGNVSSTVLDNLDTLIMMQQWDELDFALGYLKTNKNGFFNQNHVVQVFEASIRWLGGLLSAHLALSDIQWKNGEAQIRQIVAKYDGFLLEMAYDLGLRLIPAYKTSTNLPLPRIHLAKGLDSVPIENNREACSAGATTPFLEFTLLSKLTGDRRFEILTRQTVDKLWAARSSLGLLPMSFDPIGNKWEDTVTGIGASIDSFYEYALKGAIIFNDNALLDMFTRSYQSLASFSATKSGPDGWTYFANIHTTTAQPFTTWIDSLSAFWPGLQVLAGRLSDAVSSHLIFLKIWDYFDSIPERWETFSMGTEGLSNKEKVSYAVPLEWYPLRPEFIESTYYLYRATKDPMYLQIGVRVLDLFENRFKTTCGFSGYQDIRTGKMQNRMETFVLGESLKYLYLLFDESDESYVHGEEMKNKNWVFSTEAHPLWLSKESELRNQKAFNPYISQENTEVKAFKGRGFLGSMWRGLLQASNELEFHEPFEFEDGNESANLISGLRPAYDHLLYCEIGPKQWNSSRQFLGSGYYEWDRLFSPDDLMRHTLVRPDHLSKYDDNNTIELSAGFLAVYGLSPSKRCAIQPNNKETEFQVGALSRPEQYKMYKVSKETDDYPFQLGDLVMPELDGRFRVEHLRENMLDNYNVLVTRKYLIEVQPGMRGSKRSSGLDVLRVKFINGLEVTPKTNLWTLGDYLGTNPDVFTVTDKGEVYLMGQYVENLKAY